MTRKSIFDILEEHYDFNKEFKKIQYLFSVNMIHQGAWGYPIEAAVNDSFHKWKARGSCLNCADMRQELGIDELIKKEKLSTDEIIFCLEYYANIFYVFMTKCVPLPDGYNHSDNINMLYTNIQLLLEHLNYKQQTFEETDQVLLIPNDPAATAITEIAPKNIAFAILKYNHASLKGQLEEKRKLLQSIANEYEDLLKNPIDGFMEYFTTARGLLNNINVRHNNKESDLLKTMSAEDLEKWYDELYQLLLFCVLAKDNSERKKLACELLKKLKGQ